MGTWVILGGWIDWGSTILLSIQQHSRGNISIYLSIYLSSQVAMGWDGMGHLLATWRRSL